MDVVTSGGRDHGFLKLPGCPYRYDEFGTVFLHRARDSTRLALLDYA